MTFEYSKINTDGAKDMTDEMLLGMIEASFSIGPILIAELCKRFEARVTPAATPADEEDKGLTLDGLIAKLQEIKAAHGGDVKVMIEDCDSNVNSAPIHWVDVNADPLYVEIS